MYRFASLLLLALVLLVPVSMAEAQSRCVAPPGTSAVDQYCEVVPDGRGGNAAGGSGTGGGGATASDPVVAQKTATELQRSGPEGQALLATAGVRRDTTTTKKSSKPTTSDQAAGTTTGAGPTRHQAAVASSNPLVALVNAAKDEARVGSGFVWLLIGALVAMAGWGLMTTRRPDSSA